MLREALSEQPSKFLLAVLDVNCTQTPGANAESSAMFAHSDRSTVSSTDVLCHRGDPNAVKISFEKSDFSSLLDYAW